MEGVACFGEFRKESRIGRLICIGLKMNILLSCGTLACGGAERVISVLADQLVMEGHQVELLLYYDRDIWYSLDQRVKVVVDEQVIGSANMLRHMLFRRKHIKAQKPDVVLSFLAPFNMLMIVAMLGIGIPLIVADRNDPRRVPGNPVIRKARDFLYRFADGIVIQNDANRKYFSKRVRRKSTVIFNPIDLKDRAGIALRTKKRRKIVSVGRVIEAKNPKLLLDAFSLLADDYSDYELVVYGDGGLRESMIRLAEERGLSDRVKYPGAVTDIFDEIMDAEVFVMSSNYEGMPNALLEAMCLGLPVISTRVSGATDVIADGVNGLLVDCGDVKALSEAIKLMLDRETLREDCAKAAVQVHQQLSMEKITQEWQDFIDKTIAGKRRVRARE